MSNTNAFLYVDGFKFYKEQLEFYPVLSPEEEHDLFLRLKQGDCSAKEILIYSNLRLVISIAKNYFVDTLDFMDIIQEGNKGLMKAINKFDPNRGTKFSTYATHWIKQAIGRSISNDSRIIRLPVHIGERIKKVNSAVSTLRMDLQCEPTVDEVAEFCDLDCDKVIKINEFSLMDKLVYLDDTINKTSDSKKGDFIVDPVNKPTDIIFSESELKECLYSCMEDVLEPNEYRILVGRFGLNSGGHKATLSELALDLNMSAERVRQIQLAALNKLASCESLRCFI